MFMNLVNSNYILYNHTCYYLALVGNILKYWKNTFNVVNTIKITPKDIIVIIGKEFFIGWIDTTLSKFIPNTPVTYADICWYYVLV